MCIRTTHGNITSLLSQLLFIPTPLHKASQSQMTLHNRTKSSAAEKAEPMAKLRRACTTMSPTLATLTPAIPATSLSTIFLKRHGLSCRNVQLKINEESEPGARKVV